MPTYIEEDSIEVYNYIYIQGEVRMWGTLQINIGMFHLFLGGLWYHIRTTQFFDVFKNYKTYSLNAKYPLISALIHIISGTLAIIAEKKHRRSLAKFTVGMNIIGIIYSTFGLITLVTEFLTYDSVSMDRSWPESSGKLLSNYLFIYTLLYIFISWKVLKYNHDAIFYSPN